MKKSNLLKKLGLCALSAALCASAFASCGKDGEDGKKIDENTNIADVESEQVKDEAAWKAAFDVSKFTNFSMISKEKDTQGGKTEERVLAYKFTGDKAYYAVSEPKEEKTEKNEIYFSKSNDVWSAYGMVYSNGELTFEGAYGMKDHPEYDSMTSGSVGTMMISQISSEVTFDKVSYSEEKKGYIYSENGAEAVLKIADGLFAGYTMSGESGEGESKMSMEMSAIYYNIGATSVSLPEKMTSGGENPGENPGDTPTTKVTLTKDTDFAALESEKVDAAGWAKAFNYQSYTNFTVLATLDPELTFVQKATESAGYFGARYSGKDDTSKDIYSEENDIYAYIAEDGKFMGITRGRVGELPTNEHYVRDGMPIMMNYSCFCQNFAEFFEKFTYDETKKSYVYEGNEETAIRTNCYAFTDGAYGEYVKVELKIVNGLIAYISTEDTNGNKNNSKFYDFGVTEITLPNVSEN